MSDFLNRRAWENYRARPKGPFMRWAHINKIDEKADLKLIGTTAREREIPFDRSRNAEKRADRKQAVIERCARRRRESWKREVNNPHTGRPHGVAS